MRLRSLAAGLALAMLLCGAQARAHGGVSMKDDVCIMHIGPFKSHFVGYQPELRATQEFCEDIPELGRAIIVMDFIDSPLRDMGVQFLVLKDVHGLGKRAMYMDLGSADDIKAATLFSTDAQKYPRGTVTVDNTFSAPGWYIGVLNATNERTGEVYHSVFPFRVGVKSYWRYFPYFLIVVALSLVLYRMTGRAPKPKA
ncbi:MAG: hypothetical protein ISP90_07320 [Nevskia sp.]|nr:hypothetical protein [Nevskia sp.]